VGNQPASTPARTKGRVSMNSHANRWTVALAWTVGMLIVWSLFVPRTVSVTTFVLLGATGLIVSVFGAMFLTDRQSRQSVGAIIGELEAKPGTDASREIR
jgi:membrane associated rhomboid family serine protease